MRLLLLFAALALGGTIQPGWAQTTPGGGSQTAPVVVELFTSQGCASCPPADAFIGELAKLPDVIALALHVDYWDYLGWKDTFATPKYSARQKAYAKRAGSRTIFTPQIVVQGADRVKGHDINQVRSAIDAHRNRKAGVQLGVAREGGMVRIDVAPRARPPLAPPATAMSLIPAAPDLAPSPLPSRTSSTPLSVHVVTYRPSESVAIGGGENAGRAIDYANIVTSWETVADWDGAAPMQIVYRVPQPGPLAVIVQEAKIGPVLAAASGP